ncbi:hypothetical protein V6N13_025543 [Hibiscus sabdariffa]
MKFTTSTTNSLERLPKSPWSSLAMHHPSYNNYGIDSITTKLFHNLEFARSSTGAQNHSVFPPTGMATTELIQLPKIISTLASNRTT